MADQIALPIGDKWAIGFDDNQWTLCCARQRRAETYWHPVCYVGSTTTVLLRCARENGVVVGSAAVETIRAWPETFLEWAASRAHTRGRAA